MKSELEKSVSGTKDNQVWSIVVTDHIIWCIQLCVCMYISVCLCMYVFACVLHTHLSHALWTANMSQVKDTLNFCNFSKQNN